MQCLTETKNVYRFVVAKRYKTILFLVQTARAHRHTHAHTERLKSLFQDVKIYYYTLNLKKNRTKSDISFSLSRSTAETATSFLSIISQQTEIANQKDILGHSHLKR